MAFSLENRGAEVGSVTETSLGKDRLGGLEFWFKVAIFLFAPGFAVMGVISSIAIIRIAFGKS